MQGEFLELDPVKPEQKKKHKIKADVILQADFILLTLYLVVYCSVVFFTDACAAGFTLLPFLVFLTGYLLYPFGLHGITTA